VDQERELFAGAFQAGTGGSPEALALLGRVRQDSDKVEAAAFYIRALRLESRQAGRLLSRMLEEKEFVAALRTRAAAEDTVANFVWAGLMALGLDMQLMQQLVYITPQQALGMLERSAAKGYPPALVELGVILALEPLSPRTTNFMTTAAEAVELAELVDSPNCRLLLDCLAMSTESLPAADLVRQHGSWLAHFHANDRNSQGPGMGDLDFLPIFRALRDVDYRGWISVEVFSRGTDTRRATCHGGAHAIRFAYG